MKWMWHILYPLPCFQHNLALILMQSLAFLTSGKLISKKWRPNVTHFLLSQGRRLRGNCTHHEKQYYSQHWGLQTETNIIKLSSLVIHFKLAFRTIMPELLRFGWSVPSLQLTSCSILNREEQWGAPGRNTPLNGSHMDQSDLHACAINLDWNSQLKMPEPIM